MYPSVFDVIVIGAGHAGLSISYYLKKLQLKHIVFEKGRIGDTWRSQRWDSFKMNTPNKVNLLPGQNNGFSDAEGFCSAQELVFRYEEYVRTFHLPVFENCEVVSVERVSGSNEFSVSVYENGIFNYYRCKNVVVASGAQNKINIPSFSRNISPEIFQSNAGVYRNVSSLPAGAVLIVGSAQSGMQIAEDLISHGKKLFLSTSQVPRVPRRYRGKDIVDWFILTGFFDLQKKDVTDPRILMLKQPQVSNTGLRGHTISLQALAREGAVILGKTENADADSVYLQPNAAKHVKFADEFSMKTKEMIDDYILKSLLTAPAPEEDPDDCPDETASCASDVLSLSLAGNNITSVIWATGFTSDFSYLKLPVFDDHGTLIHNEGISDIEGLYFLGIPWLRKRKSGIIPGIGEDAEFIAGRLLSRC